MEETGWAQDLVDWWTELVLVPDAAICEAYGTARIQRFDPLALDLDGDGMETLAADGSVLFDHNGDGVRTGTGWVSGDDGLLALDRNGNGVIDSGAELFGVHTRLADGSLAADGFAALAGLDANGDGLFDAADPAFSAVRVWRDLNGDGRSGGAELRGLADSGVLAIDLRPTPEATALAGGNLQTASASYARADGGTGTAANLDLVSNPFYRELPRRGAVSPDAAALPQLGGSGAVGDLREAASGSGSVSAALQAYLAQASRDGQLGQLDGLLHAWGASSAMPSSVDRAAANDYMLIYLLPDQSPQAYEPFLAYWLDTPASLADVFTVEERQLLVERKERQAELGQFIATLERFNGVPFVDVGADALHTGSGQQVEVGLSRGGVSDSGQVLEAGIRRVYVPLTPAQVDALESSFAALRESVYAGLLFQGRLQGYVQAMSLGWGEEGLSVDLGGLDQRLAGARAADPAAALCDLIELNRYGAGTLYALGWTGLARLEQWVAQAAGDPTLQSVLRDMNVLAVAGSQVGGDSAETLFGSLGADFMAGGSGDDTLSGGAGADRLRGDLGDDLIAGGAGDDQLSGGRGSDLYLFGHGDGHDRIADGGAVDDANRVLLGPAVEPGEVHLQRLGQDLRLSLAGGADRLDVSNFFWNDAAEAGNRVDEIRFVDGTRWSLERIKELVLSPTEFADTLVGYASDDVLVGLGGNDRLSGAGGDDRLLGGDGADYLWGNEGEDRLDGGAHTDRLYGNAGGDLLDGGDGRDYLYGNDGDDLLDGGAGDDWLDGGAGSDLFRFGWGSGRDVVAGYDPTPGKVDSVEFAAGITPTDVALSRQGSSLVLTLTGSADRLTLSNYFWNDALSGEFRVEHLRFADGRVWTVEEVKQRVLQPSEGADSLIGYASDDRLSGGGGADALYGESGDDQLYGGAGDDRLYGRADGDRLYGEAGNDRLYGNDGDDLLDGGAGADRLDGGAGSDLYRFGPGAGQDLIQAIDAAPGARDVIEFAPALSPEQLWMTRVGNDLQIAIIGSEDRISVGNWYLDPAWRVDALRCADGRELGAGQVEQLVTAMAAYAPPAPGSTSLPPEYREALEPVIAASWA